jgi:hypothetical protein
MPWPGIGDGDVMDGIKNGSKLERPTGVPLCCYDIMLACWHIEPDSRPSAAQLVKMIAALDEKDLIPPPEEEPDSQPKEINPSGSFFHLLFCFPRILPGERICSYPPRKFAV